MMAKQLNVFFLTSLILSPLFAEQDIQSTVLRERPEVTIDRKRELPKNLARWHMGTTLIETSEKGQEIGAEWALPSGPKQNFGSFLSDDETESVFLEEGRQVYIVNFQGPELVDRFFTKSFGGVAKIQLLGSESVQGIRSKKWKPLGRKQKIHANEFLEIRFTPSEVQYIAIVYDVSETGDFGNLGFVGELNVAETRLPTRIENQSFSQKTEQVEDAYNYDFATTYSGSSIPFSSEDATKEEVENVIDDDFRTYYDLEPSERPSAMIIDLNESTFINKVSLLFEAQSGRVEFYFLERLPGEEVEEGTAFFSPSERDGTVFVKEYFVDALGRPLLLAQSTRLVEIAQNSDTQMREITLDEGFFDGLDARYVEEIEAGQERVSIPVDNQTSRYVLLRWIPSDSAQGSSEVTMRIYELSVFGPMPMEEAYVERGFELDELAPAAGGDVATGSPATEPGSPQDPAAPPTTQTLTQDPLIPPTTPVSQ
ncbi:MAG: hypothetical protein ACPGN3_05785 [Opitutales bacterium]